MLWEVWLSYQYAKYVPRLEERGAWLGQLLLTCLICTRESIQSVKMSRTTFLERENTSSVS